MYYFLWDESFLWGLTAYKSFVGLGVPLTVVTAAEVRAGALSDPGVLIVPGGWASDKTVALGEAGREAMRGFVKAGGGYLGLCGGAGLALDVDGGLALTHVSRVPTKHRVPSFSGDIDLVPEDTTHPLWRGIRRPYRFHAWWPGQFHLGDGDGVKVIARYGGPGPDFCLADLPSSDVAGYGDGWERWEESYGINLNPDRLVGEPSIIEAGFGAGMAFLSYLHLETPGSRKGNRALLNVLEYLRPMGTLTPCPSPAGGEGLRKIDIEAVKAATDMMRAAKEFISFGERNFLWHWRNGWVLQWRRGVRGVEYSTVYGLIREIDRGMKTGVGYSDPTLSGKIVALQGIVAGFFDGAKKLLLLERHAMMSGQMSSIYSHDPEVMRLRARLFSNSKRFGGEFKTLLDALDDIILGLIRG